MLGGGGRVQGIGFWAFGKARVRYIFERNVEFALPPGNKTNKTAPPPTHQGSTATAGLRCINRKRKL